MNRRNILSMLVLSNVALAGLLIWRQSGSIAVAQPAPEAVRGDDVLMIPGEAAGAGGVSLVYVLDQSTGVLSAIALDSRDRLQAMPPIALEPIFEQARAADVIPPANDRRRR